MAEKELREYLNILFPSILSEHFCWLVVSVIAVFLECSFKTVTDKTY